MKLRTEIDLQKPPFQLDYQSKMIFLGSCFAENIGSLITERKFKALINPLGISYNPHSLFKNLEFIVNQKKLVHDELSKNGDLYYHFDFHGNNNKTSRELYLESINNRSKVAHDFFATANVLFISLGTANIFQHHTHGIVNNCHKIANHHFERRLLSVSEVTESLKKLIGRINSFNPNLKIVFTVSPIRHIRDGLIQDRRSKSILIAAIHELVDGQSASYFPSYEMLTDDLRDYRFYEKDLIHPNEMGRAYIWEKFKDSYLSENCKKRLKKVERILTSMNHRPIHENGKAYKEHLRSLKTQIEELKDFDFSVELAGLGLVNQ